MTLRGAMTSVAGRLALLLCGLAAVSTGVALVLQDRALDQELRGNARDRLVASARTADALIGDHLRGVASRYAAISRTPELRANLQTRHAPTLSFYASQLLRDQEATLIAFVSSDGESLTAAGDPRLIEVARQRTLGDRGGAQCIEVGDAGAGARPVGGGAWAGCRYPYGQVEASLFASGGDLYALVAVPLRSGKQLEGGLLAVEAIGEPLLTRWSGLSGATLHVGPLEAGGGEIEAPVRSLAHLDLRVSSTYQAERETIRRARANLVASGVLALLLALGASLLLARRFASPIVHIREATDRLNRGDLDSRVELDRGDELGQLGQAFNELASQLTASQERVRRAQRLARFGNWYFDFEAGEFEGTSEFRRLLGIAPQGPVALRVVLEHVHPEDRDEFEGVLQAHRVRSAPFRLDVRVQAPGTPERIVHVRGHARNRTASRIEGSIQDVTERRAAEEQIRYLSRHDPLTGLGNRDQAMEFLERRIRDAAAGPFAVIMIGLDDLQEVTDTFGHAVSDQLLVEVAQRLVGNLREAPRAGAEETDMVARLGDDRFSAVLEGVEHARGAAAAAERLLAAVRGPYDVGGEEVSVTTSAGVAMWPGDAARADTLLRNAETALTRVQREQPGGTRFFHESMTEDATRRIQISNRLRRALEEGALELHYQPRIQPRTGSLVGFEGLARWTDDELGPVPPGEFIPIAESTGTIHRLGAWCVESAARQLRAWHEAGHVELAVSVNLSRHQLEPRLVERVVVCTEGLDRTKFELEVTESALIEEGDAAIETLTALRAHGFRIALDDFGTGYSSLSYLQGLPIDTVKLDRGFIQDIADDPDAAALAGSVLAMCRALRLHTVVEGVETEEQLAVLVELGYTEVQGFLFSKPLPPAEAERFLARARKATAPPA